MKINDKRVAEMDKCYEQSDILHFVPLALSYMQEHPMYPELRDDLENVRSCYNNMLQCFKRGVDDPKRVEIFLEMEDFVFDTYQNIILNERIQSNQVLLAARKRGETIELLHVRELLENHQGDLEFYNTLFSAVLTSWRWNEKLKEYYATLIMDPETDPVLASLLVSALTLSGLLVFDICKFNTLVEVYKASGNATLQERALVGWCFSSCYATDREMKYVKKAVLECLEDKNAIQEIVELQKQVFYCMEADKDSEKTTQVLMSNLSSEQVARTFKSDLEDNSLNDILYPEQEEENAEKLEKNVSKMLQMQKDGADIYFGGFSKMKSFAFFHRLSNWFIPYSIDNPVLEPLRQAFDGDDTILRSLRDSSPFCESDKFSFSFALVETLKRGPAQFKQILKENLLFQGSNMMMKEMDPKTWKRRMYLQDLCRFFKVSSFASAFSKPFDEDDQEEMPGCLFLQSWDLEKASVLLQPRLKICRFLIKRKDYKHLGQFASLISNENLDEGTLLYALYLMNYQHAYHEAVMLLSVLYIAGGDKVSLTVVKAMAKCLMELKIYEEALKKYRVIQKRKPSNSNLLKMAYCMLYTNQVEEAMEILYKLDYENPDNIDVVRSLAWGNMLRENFDSAIALYQKLQTLSGGASLEDVYNTGLCYWLKGDMAKTCEYFKEYNDKKGKQEPSLFEKIDSDYQLLEKHGINYGDLFLMRDSIEK